MQKWTITVLSTLLLLCCFVACSQDSAYVDGMYRAEFQDFDSRGYKDFLEITVEDGVVSSLHFNAVNEDGLLKNDDVEYREEMQAVQNIYPEQFSQDLINQYLDTHDISEVDAVAGATYSSESFTSLFTALELQMQNGDSETLIVENTLEK